MIIDALYLLKSLQILKLNQYIFVKIKKTYMKKTKNIEVAVRMRPLLNTF
jgi:hypothetical protein